MIFSTSLTESTVSKRDVALNLIPQYYDSWMLSDSDKAGITFYPVDLCPPGVYINTHVLIFEGAGDLFVQGPRNFRLLDVDRKYNCVTEFRKIDFPTVQKESHPPTFLTSLPAVSPCL